MIDLHCHLAAGIDDGPETAPAAVGMARVAVASGTKTLVATPHVDDHFGLGPREILEAIARTRRAVAAAGVPLEVVPGAEVALERYSALSPAELSALTLGRGSWILLECPLSRDAGPLEHVVFDLQVRGFSVLLAHPERSPGLVRDPDRLRALVDRGARCSITTGSLRGQFGKEPQRAALRLLQDDLVHNLASDAHDAERRPPGLRGVLAEAGDSVEGIETLEAWLCRDVPRAILNGAALPPRPTIGVRSRRRRVLR